MKRRDLVRSGLAATALAGVTTLVRAQGAFPNRPISFVVPFAAGGGGDVIARLVAKGLSERFPTGVVVENRVGASGNIGAAHVLKSPPDGYTLLNMSSTYAIQAAVNKKLPYDPIGDLQPVMMVSRDPVVAIVHPDSPIRDAKVLADLARKSPGKISHGSAGMGSIAHMAAEELGYNMGVQLLHVPYKGSSQAFTDVMGRSVDLMFTSATFAAQHVKTGRVRAIGISGTRRSSQLPEVATFAEQGYPKYQVVDWKAIGGPRGMPPEVLGRLNRELNEVLKMPAIRDKFESEGTTVLGGSPEDMSKLIREDIERWTTLVKAANLSF
jgi:tripartite-type tricarboxylate transporter receptor subunit TctC